VPDAETPEKLKRERAGTYTSAEGRFTVEQTSSGWLLLDAEQTNELGLPLTRGPFGTLDEARLAIAEARSRPAPKAEVVDIAARLPKRGAGASGRGQRTGARRAGTDARDDGAEADAREEEAPRTAGREQTTASKPKPRAKRPEKPTVVVRELRAVDGDQLRKLWAACGFRSLGDDDLSLARLARRNPGLLLVASEGTQIVGSALGAWDGRRGWIYHLAIAETHRRQGIATRLIDQVEAGLRDLGCPKVSVLVRDENDDGREFWTARGYDQGSRQFARQLRGD
jgi:ribosomal protein S18 acetylase RimI-like enzyme